MIIRVPTWTLIIEIPISISSRGILTVANNGDAFSFKIITPVPTSRVHHLALEVFYARNFRFAGEIQLADCGNQEVRVEDIGAGELAVLLPRYIDGYFPFQFTIIPACFFDC